MKEKSISIHAKHLQASSNEINIADVPDTMSRTNQFVSDVKEIVTNLYQTMTGRLFQWNKLFSSIFKCIFLVLC